DGGSYSLCFYSTDGDWYEFFIPIKFDGDVATGYETPRLYFHSFNDCNVVRTFTWEEAQQFVAPLSFDNARFHELVHIVQTRGHFPPGAINS
ncbi:MAG: hypothetical protein KDA78_06655, partial [Planctomycetaceae bacterium]|nr:hypothetical protein [Planctomycetaceae bacterium]